MPIEKIPFQYDRDLYVKTPLGLNLGGKKYKRGEYIPWRELNMDLQKMEVLYNSGQVYHNETFAVKRAESKRGDGLEEMTLIELYALKDKLNKQVDLYYKTDKKKRMMKCPKSTLKDRQIAHIRRWRSLNPKVEDYDPELEVN